MEEIIGRRVLVEKKFCREKLYMKEALNVWSDEGDKTNERLYAVRLMKEVFPGIGLAYIGRYMKNPKAPNMMEYLKGHSDNEEG